MDENFNSFLDSILIEAAARQDGAKVKWLPLKELCLAVKADAAPTWIEMVGDRIRALDYGELQRDSEKPGLFWFELNGTGLARAHEVKAERRQPSLGERFRSVPWGKCAWDLLKIGIGAVLGVIATKYFGK